MHAIVAIKPGRAATAAELTEYVKQRVAVYKYPRDTYFAPAVASLSMADAVVGHTIQADGLVGHDIISDPAS